MERIYFGCSSCRLGVYPLDEQIGLDQTLAPGARRMACLAGTLATSFARGSELLWNLAGWTVSDETLSEVCYREGERMKAWRTAAQPEAVQPPQQGPAVDEAKEFRPHCHQEVSQEVTPPVSESTGSGEGVTSSTREPIPILEAAVVTELVEQFPELASIFGLPSNDGTDPTQAGQPASESSEPDVAETVGVVPAVRETERFRKAKGEIELEIDGGKVNTTEGWREMKIGIFAKREAGEAATAEEWADRKLPRPSVRVAFTAIERSNEFGPECRAWAARLGIRETSKISIIADGAPWIWTLAACFFCRSRKLLDIFHVLEYVAAASRMLFGSDSEEGPAWQARVRQAVLSEGWLGLCRQVLQTLLEHPGESTQAALEPLLGYLAPRLYLLDYAERLRRGEPIGSGMVEGAVKTLINKRLKANGARWDIKNVVRMAELCSLHYSDSWSDYWTAA